MHRIMAEIPFHTLRMFDFTKSWHLYFALSAIVSSGHYDIYNVLN